jgi:sarcosine oxidase subunit beta
MKQISDVIIVGGGLMGCSTAFHLAGRGVDVTVLERGSVGLGATGRSSAIVRQHYSNELTARMALHSLRVFEDFDERVGGECGFTRTGFLVTVADPDRPGMEANVALQREVGIETRLLSPEDLAEVMPGLETADLACAAGHGDPVRGDPCGGSGHG